MFGVNSAMPYVSHGCLKSTQKLNFQIKGITSLIEGDFFGKYFYSFVLCFFLLFLYFCVFCLFRRIPFKYGGSGRLLRPFKDVFQKPIKI